MVLSAIASADAKEFAQQELKRYLPNAPQTVLTIDESLQGGGDAFSITRDGDAIKIIATNDNSLLNGVYHLLDLAGYRFLAPNFDHYKGSAEVEPASKEFNVKL